MLLNINKTKIILFNFTTNYQFSTRLKIDGIPLEILNEVKLLGTILTNDLTWYSNTNIITRKAYMRMGLLHKLIQFGVPIQDLVQIYTLFIRSICEQSAVVWHSSLTQENGNNIERVQKTALKIILREKYNTYESALEETKLKSYP